MRPWNCCGHYHICQNLDICNESEECHMITVANILAEDGIDGQVYQVPDGEGFHYLFTLEKPRGRFERWNRKTDVLRKRREEKR